MSICTVLSQGRVVEFLEAGQGLWTVESGDRHGALFGVQHGRFGHGRCLVVESGTYHWSYATVLQEFP